MTVLVQLIPAFAKLVLKSQFIGGQEVKLFEENFKRALSAEHCIGVANGTDALEVILRGLGFAKGTPIIVPANSFYASAEAVLNCGYDVVLVDVTDSFSIDISDLKKKLKLNPSVAGVVLVHLYGQPQDPDVIRSIFGDREIAIVEDCAQAHLAHVDGKYVGTLGTAGAFSFFPGKNLGAMGDAGAILTQDDELAERFRRLSNHGRLGKFDHELVGRNSRLDPLQALVLNLKLSHLANWTHRRQKNAALYRHLLSDVPGVELPPLTSQKSVYHHFVIRVDDREGLKEFLNSNGIATGVHYPKSISELPPFKGNPVYSCPNSERLSREVLSIPVAEHLRPRQIRRVATLIKAFYGARLKTIV